MSSCNQTTCPDDITKIPSTPAFSRISKEPYISILSVWSLAKQYYPESVLASKLEDTVNVRVLVLKTGKIDTCYTYIESIRYPVFEQPTKNLVKGLSFTPALDMNDNPIVCFVSFPIRFTWR